MIDSSVVWPGWWPGWCWWCHLWWINAELLYKQTHMIRDGFVRVQAIEGHITLLSTSKLTQYRTDWILVQSQTCRQTDNRQKVMHTTRGAHCAYANCQRILEEKAMALRFEESQAVAQLRSGSLVVTPLAVHVLMVSLHSVTTCRIPTRRASRENRP